MPFRSKETLDAWLDEFRATREGGLLINVVVQDGAEGADTGLVVVPLKNAAMDIYMQPLAVGDDQWAISFESHPNSFDLSPEQLHGFAAELALAASLCAFLKEKSLGHDEAEQTEQA